MHSPPHLRFWRLRLRITYVFPIPRLYVSRYVPTAPAPSRVPPPPIPTHSPHTHSSRPLGIGSTQGGPVVRAGKNARGETLVGC